MYVKFKYQVYYDEKTGYSVCQYKTDEGKKVTCVGTNLPTIPNLTYDFVTEEYTSKHGLSYKVLSYTEHVGKTEDDIVAYLSCGLFKGISKKTAQKIYDTFTSDTLAVLDSDITRLAEVKGIGKKTVQKIKTSYIEKRVSREIADILLKYGVSINSINRLYETFKADAIRIIKEEPYRLCEIRGISFPIADLIAKDNSFYEDCYERVVAASNYVLSEDMASGNVCMPKTDYALKLIRALNTPKITKENILNYVLTMIKDGSIKYNKRLNAEKKEEYFYLPITYYAERNIAANIQRLLSEKKRRIANLDELIDKYSEGICLDESQRAAIKIGVTEPLFIITGGPGTGKTTILKIIGKINEEINHGKNNNLFLSPTGKAARRITESTGYDAQTIHSAIRLRIVEDERFVMESDSEETIKDTRVIIDESSMIDLWTFDGLLRNLHNSTLGLIGDIDQLPSVRCGSILRDLIACNAIPVVQLTNIHRQSNDAINICENAMNIRNGVHLLKEGNDFEIINAKTLEDAEKNVIDAAMKHIATYGADNVKVLCPFKKGTCGVYRVNSLLQDLLNPMTNGLEVKIPNDMCIRVGDPVMQLRNIEEVSNGDIGYITSITADEIEVAFSGIHTVYVSYSYADAKEQLTLAYASTVHKSQGMEHDAIVLCLTEKHGLMKKRNILYTGITRGKHTVTLVGTETAFYDAIDNNMIEDRHSFLTELIKKSESKPMGAVVAFKEKIKYEQMNLPFCK